MSVNIKLCISCMRLQLKRRGRDLNRGIKVLQTFALPLGHGTKDLIMLSKKTTLVNNLYAIKQKRETDFCFSFVWSGRRDSNSRPSPWQGDALPLSHFRISMFYHLMLFNLLNWSREMDSNHRKLS